MSFIFCSHILNIGNSIYDRANNNIGNYYCNPRSLNVRRTCKSASLPPVEIRYTSQSQNIEPIVNELLPKYLELREDLTLSDVLTKFFIAKDTYVGINFPILSNALEVLATAIVKSENQNSTIKSISEKDFCALITEEIKSIDKKLHDIKGGKKILDRIKRASYTGPNEKLTLMFEILNLRIGNVEKEAIKTRNKMAHSAFPNPSDQEAKKYIKMTRAYETLFQRLILKILGFGGNYIDYYSANHIARSINDPVSE